MQNRPTTVFFKWGAIGVSVTLAGCASDDLESALPSPEASSIENRLFHTNGMEEHLSDVRAMRGKMFLRDNEKRPGVKTRPSGLQFEILEKGDGERPTLRDTVVTQYKAITVDGTVVDDSADYGGPQEFRVDKVIAGWREALQEMRVGGKWTLYVPPELAYGDQGMAQIPGGETLIYELELISIERGGATELSVEDMDPEPEETRSAEPVAAEENPSRPPRRDFSLDNLDLLD